LITTISLGDNNIGAERKEAIENLLERNKKLKSNPYRGFGVISC